MLHFEFRNNLDDVFKNAIEGLQDIDEINERLKKQWKYDDDFNFLYGRTIGFYQMVARKMFRDTYDHESNNEENDEMDELLETHAVEIKKIFEKFKK